MIGNMIRKRIAAGHAVFAVFVAGASLLGQAPPARPSAAGLEFPVIMRHNVVAGTTAVGTKVEAKLTVATFVSGVVVPQGAILSGEVTESVAKSASTASRLCIRMDSAQWKNKSAPVVLQFTKKVYLSAWYYPMAPIIMPRDLSDEPPPSPSIPGRWNGPANLPTQSQSPLPTTTSPTADATTHRTPMKDVESARNDKGDVTLVSKRFNIKLDKSTTYVLTAADLAVGPG